MSNILELKNITFSYPKDQKKIFDNFSLSVKKDEFLVIMGENGCGKSTLLNIISGLKVQNNGEIHLNNKNISEFAAQARDIAYVFQNVVLYPHLSVYQNLHFVLKYYGLKESEIDLKIKNVLSTIKMISKVNFKPRHLSEGEKQRLSLAKAIIREPSLFLLDEPFSNLDNQNIKLMIDLLLELKNKYKTTLIMVSHNFDSISNVATRLVIIKDGKIYFDGTPVEALLSEDNYIKHIIS